MIDELEIIGIIGVLALLSSYGFFQMDKINDFWFALIGGIGSSLIIINLLDKWNLSSFLIELGWMAISFYGAWKHRHLRVKLGY